MSSPHISVDSFDPEFDDDRYQFLSNFLTVPVCSWLGLFVFICFLIVLLSVASVFALVCLEEAAIRAGGEPKDPSHEKPKTRSPES